MEYPNLRQTAHKCIDSHSGSIIGIIQIIVDSNGYTSTAMAGHLEILEKALAHEMKNDCQVKDIFETALNTANKSCFDPSMN